MLFKVLIIYLFIGMALQPAYRDMQFRIWKKHGVPSGEFVCWYTWFIIETVFWPIAFSFKLNQYFKIIIKGESPWES